MALHMQKLYWSHEKFNMYVLLLAVKDFIINDIFSPGDGRYFIFIKLEKNGFIRTRKYAF